MRQIRRKILAHCVREHYTAGQKAVEEQLEEGIRTNNKSQFRYQEPAGPRDDRDTEEQRIQKATEEKLKQA